MNRKGVYAKLIVRHEHLWPDDTIYYIKPIVWTPYGTPLLYGILDRETGKVVLEITANEFKNRFEILENYGQ